MEQFDNWQGFWDNFLLDRYGKAQAQTEADLYCQVGRTVHRKPVPKDVFDKIIEQIIADLSFEKDDVLVDFCCGNGLFTYELKDKVSRIIGVDFAPNIIEAANKFKSARNISYCLDGVVGFMKTFREKWPGIVPNKYLMNDSLAYFTNTDLENMLSAIIEASGSFKYLIRGVPSDLLKWNYYNTEERKQAYYNYPLKGDFTNDGVGKWWVPDEIKTICDRLHLNCAIRNQQLPVSDYRMDIMISRD